MIYQNENNIWNNISTKRFLPIPESVSKHLEPEPKLSDFIIIQELGSGSFGHVILAQHKITQVKYAIKAIDKRNTVNIKEMPYFIREIEIMYRVHHPNVVKLFGHFEDNNYCYFIMEYIPGGNIYSLVQRLKPVTLQGIASIMKEVISAVYFLHHMTPKIVHRDIKPENVLLDQGNHAKLTDFGWSNYMEGDTKRTTVCGTPVYLAPEIINNMGHDEHVDIWCIGVLLFELIVGRPPFNGETEQKVRYNILKMKINWPSNMDSDAADLITKILKYNPYERISLEQMLLHPFFTKFFPNAISTLIKPDKSIQYRVFIVSKDNPLTWNPIFNGNNHGLKLKPYNGNAYSLNQYNYDDLYQKYENLKKEYNDLRNAGFSSAALDSLRRELKEKENKLNQLMNEKSINQNNKNQIQIQPEKQNYNNNSYNISYNYQNQDNSNINVNNIGYDYKTNNDLRITYDDLINENYNLKNRLSQYENHFNQQNEVIYLDNNFNEIRNSITNNNKLEFNQAFDKLKTDIDTYTQSNYNTIISMKDQEIERWKKEEKLRKEREDQELKALIHAYDTSLSMGERENEELKKRLKELEGFFI